MKERKIVIATHGTLAEGFRSALKIIATDEGVETYCCYTTPDFNLEKTIQTIMNAYDEETQEFGVVLEDVYSVAWHTDESDTDYLISDFEEFQDDYEPPLTETLDMSQLLSKYKG